MSEETNDPTFADIRKAKLKRALHPSEDERSAAWRQLYETTTSRGDNPIAQRFSKNLDAVRRERFRTDKIDPSDYPQYDIIEGIEVRLILHPAAAGDVKYLVDTLSIAARTEEPVTVTIRGFGLDTKVRSVHTIRLPSFDPQTRGARYD